MKIIYSIFPKFYKHLDPHGLAEVVRRVGLDTTNVIIRDGYWVTAAGLKTELPVFVSAMRDEGLNIHFATSGYSAEELIADPSPLGILADNGIKEFRMAYFQPLGHDVRGGFIRAREQLEQLAPLCERYGVRAVYQLHAGTLVTSPSAAWMIVNDLPPEWIGVEIDPGNQAYEGYENWFRSARLLREYVVAAGVKDAAIKQDIAHADDPGKGWGRPFVPLYEGITNWHDFVKALAEIDFSGTFVFMPFYDSENPDVMTEKLAREVAYLRSIVATMD